MCRGVPSIRGFHIYSVDLSSCILLYRQITWREVSMYVCVPFTLLWERLLPSWMRKKIPEKKLKKAWYVSHTHLIQVNIFWHTRAFHLLKYNQKKSRLVPKDAQMLAPLWEINIHVHWLYFVWFVCFRVMAASTTPQTRSMNRTSLIWLLIHSSATLMSCITGSEHAALRVERVNNDLVRSCVIMCDVCVWMLFI